MGSNEYIAAREFASNSGQPVITYIFVLALMQFIFAIKINSLFKR